MLNILITIEILLIHDLLYVYCMVLLFIIFPLLILKIKKFAILKSDAQSSEADDDAREHVEPQQNVPGDDNDATG